MSSGGSAIPHRLIRELNEILCVSVQVLLQQLRHFRHAPVVFHIVFLEVVAIQNSIVLLRSFPVIDVRVRVELYRVYQYLSLSISSDLRQGVRRSFRLFYALVQKVLQVAAILHF